MTEVAASDSSQSNITVLCSSVSLGLASDCTAPNDREWSTHRYLETINIYLMKCYLLQAMTGTLCCKQLRFMAGWFKIRIWIYFITYRNINMYSFVFFSYYLYKCILLLNYSHFVFRC